MKVFSVSLFGGLQKISLVILAAIIFFSCSLGPMYSTQYTGVVSFEYDAVYGVDYKNTFNADSTFYDSEGKVGIGWDDVIFYHKVSEYDKSFLGGWKLSYQKPVGADNRDKELPEGSYPSDYRAMTYHYGTSNRTYAVFHQNSNPSQMPENDFKFASPEHGTCQPLYCWINNTESVYKAVKENFEENDKLVLTAVGYLAGAETGRVNLQMAAADTTVYNWTKMDLSKLGNIDAIDFELSSTKSGIPMYFCMDDMTVKVAIEIN